MRRQGWQCTFLATWYYYHRRLGSRTLFKSIINSSQSHVGPLWECNTYECSDDNCLIIIFYYEKAVFHTLAAIVHLEKFHAQEKPPPNACLRAINEIQENEGG